MDEEASAGLARYIASADRTFAIKKKGADAPTAQTDRPLRPQERRVLAALRARPHWVIDELLDELSRGRRDPFTVRALYAQVYELRRLGYAVRFHRMIGLVPRR